MELKGLPLREWLQVKNISRKQFANNFGVSMQTVNNWVRGGSCKPCYYDRLKKLGIDINLKQHKCNFNNDKGYVSINKIKHTSDLKVKPNEFTVRTYIEWHNMSIEEFAEQNEVSCQTVRRWFEGGKIQPNQVKKLESLGIVGNYREYTQPKIHIDDELNLPKKNGKKTVKKEFPEYVLYCFKLRGNTIVSKNFSKEEIIFYFKNEGYDVKVREQNFITDDKHYVVELIG